MRVGLGYDVHRFGDDPERALMLGGVHFPGECGLVGHSDADVIAHACCDALLGAAGLGDMGTHFPEDEKAWQDADSLELLKEVTKKVTKAGWEVQSLDCTVATERPRVAPRRLEMQARLGEAAGAPVSVKATTTDGLGDLGKGEGIACWAVALLT